MSFGNASSASRMPFVGLAAAGLLLRYLCEQQRLRPKAWSRCASALCCSVFGYLRLADHRFLRCVGLTSKLRLMFSGFGLLLRE